MEPKKTLKEEIKDAEEIDRKLLGSDEEFFEVLAQLAKYEEQLNIFLGEKNETVYI